MSDLPITSRIVIPAAELHEAFARAGGPGGQHVNKTETKVELRWNPDASEVLTESDRAWLVRRLGGRLTQDGDLIVTAGDHRSQKRNRETARERLAEIVREALRRPKHRKRTRPSRSAVDRRIKEKKQRGERKKSRRWKPGD